MYGGTLGGGRDAVVVESVWRRSQCRWHAGGKCVAVPMVDVRMWLKWKVCGGAFGANGAEVESVWRYPWLK